MPATSQKQQKFMGIELARKRAGEPTKTGMSEAQLEEFASTPRKGLPVRASDRAKKLAAYQVSRRKSAPTPQRHVAAAKAGHARAAKPNAHAPVGQGGRFAALENKLASEPGVYNPAGLAGKIGRRKYGAGRMADMAAAGR